MTYRDDRQALQERVRVLEDQLAGARRAGEEEGREAAETRVNEMQVKLAGVREEMDRMEAELAALRRNAPKGAPPGARLLTAVLVAAAAAGGLYLALGRKSPPAPILVAPVTPAPPPPDPPAPPPKVEPVPAPAKAAPKPEPEARVARARWRATVKRSEGAAIGAGQVCFIDAAIEAKVTNARVSELTVTCGKETIYDRATSFNGMAQMSSDPRERLGPSDDRGTFALSYSDVGTRSGRPQIQIDTPSGQAEVWSDNLPRFRVELRVPPASEPTEPHARAGQRLRRSARVTEVSGAAPVKVGAACLLRAMPTGRQSDCEAELTCGAAVLLASSAPARCEYDSMQPVKVTTAGGPVTLQMGEGSMEVTAEKPVKYTAVLAFDPG